MGIPMWRKQRPWDRLIFNMGLSTLVRRNFCIQTAPLKYSKLSWCNYCDNSAYIFVKSLQLIWKSGIPIFQLLVSGHQMSGTHHTWYQKCRTSNGFQRPHLVRSPRRHDLLSVLIQIVYVMVSCIHTWRYIGISGLSQYKDIVLPAYGPSC